MTKAKDYGKERFVMYNEQADAENLIFALNKRLIADGANTLTSKILEKF